MSLTCNYRMGNSDLRRWGVEFVEKNLGDVKLAHFPVSENDD
jgi:hypothetical protein